MQQLRQRDLLFQNIRIIIIVDISGIFDTELQWHFKKFRIYAISLDL